MTKEKTASKKRKSGYKNIILITAIIIAIVGIPLLLLNYQARHTGLTRGEVIRRVVGRSATGGKENAGGGEKLTGEKIDFLDPRPIGQEFTDPPLIAHIQVVDLDDDQLLDVILCDDRGN